MSTNKVIYNPLNDSNLQYLSTTAETIADVTHEPTGFHDPKNVVSTYSVANRTIVLTHSSGTIDFSIRGVEYSYASPWTVPTVLGGATPIAHTNANGTYYLKINQNTLAITFDTTPFNFETDMMISLAIKSATYQFAQRETHGVMPWQAHEEFHFANGSYLHTAAVATVGTYAVLAKGSGTDVANTPGVDLWDQHDEDLETEQSAWLQGTYTVAYRNGVGGDWVMSTTESFPFMYAGGTNFIKYNLNTAGTWSLADVTEDQFVNILMMGVPVTSDADSQKYRLVCFVGQNIYTTLAAAQAASPLNFDFGSLISNNPEFVPLLMWTYEKNSVVPNAETTTGNARLAAEPTKFIGTSRSITGIGGVAPSDHQALSNRTALDSHPIGAISPSNANRFIVSNTTNTALTEVTGAAFTLVGFDASGVPRSDGVDAHLLALGTTAQRPTASAGMVRYNTSLGYTENYDGVHWTQLGRMCFHGTAAIAPTSTVIYTPSTVGTRGVQAVSYEAYIVLNNGTNRETLHFSGSMSVAGVWTGTLESSSGTDLLSTFTIETTTGAISIVPVASTDYECRVWEIHT